jgi:hypothetical protein
LFAAINGWTPTYFFLRRHTPFFICQEHSSFHSYRSGLVWQRSFNRVSSVLSRPKHNTHEIANGAFGRPVLTGLSPRELHETRRVDVNLRRSYPLAFWVGGRWWRSHQCPSFYALSLT